MIVNPKEDVNKLRNKGCQESAGRGEREGAARAGAARKLAPVRANLLTEADILLRRASGGRRFESCATLTETRCYWPRLNHMRTDRPA